MNSAKPSQPLGLDQVEAEHALQIQLLHDIEAALTTGSRDGASQLIDQLEQFTEAHFASEQVLMRLHSWSGYFEHEREHGALLEELKRLRGIIASEPAGDGAAVAAALRQWLTGHIGTADRAFTNYLREAAPARIAAGP
jgi:hemerythrin-like metal-binding protein